MSRIAKLERELRGQTICQAILVGGFALVALTLLRPVLLPFVLSIFIVSGLTPVLSGIESRFSTTRLVAVVIASVVGLALVFLLWSILWVSVAQLADESPKYLERIRATATYVQDTMQKMSDSITNALGTANSSETSKTSETKEEGANVAEAAQPDAVEAEKIVEADNDNSSTNSDQTAYKSNDAQPNGNPLSRQLGSQVTKLFEWALAGIRDATIEVVTSGTMVVIFVFFLLLGSSQAIPGNETWREIDSKIREYIVTKTLISFFTGIAFAFSLWLFGIPLAIVFGLMAFLFNFIPNIGPILACLLPLPLIIFHPELSVFEMVLAITVSSAVQIVSGNVVEPRMMGDSFDVHPIAILLALMFWGLIWGIVGMFLAVPMTAIMKILFAKFKMTKPLADLLAGRFDSESFRNFYFGEGDESQEPKPEASN